MRTGEICSARCPLCHRGRFKDLFPAQGILERPEQNALSHRLEKKNWRASVALLTLRKQVDMDEVAHLSRYERERGYVQHICTCQWETRQYHAFLEEYDSRQYVFQICNHNLLLADAIHRGSGRSSLPPETCALIVDETHKLPETARQIFGVTLAAEDIRALAHSLRAERFVLVAEVLSNSAKPLLRKLDRPPEDRTFEYYQSALAALERSLTVIHRQIRALLTPAAHRKLEKLSFTVSQFRQDRTEMVFYTEEDAHGGTILCAAISDLTAQLRQTLWRQERPAILTSATLAMGEDFRCFKEETGLLTDSCITLIESNEFQIILFSSFSQTENESTGLNIVMGMWWQIMKEGKIPFQYSRTMRWPTGPASGKCCREPPRPSGADIPPDTPSPNCVRYNIIGGWVYERYS